jgi:hypothetical protein
MAAAEVPMTHSFRRRPRLSFGAAVVAALLLLGAAAADAGDNLDQPTRERILEAVQAAYELDFYNNRCRNDRSGRRTENLNKELASRFRMTVIDALDDLTPEGYYRDAQARMERELLDLLREMGGCAGAKAAGLPDDLRERYDRAMDWVRRYP